MRPVKKFCTEKNTGILQCRREMLKTSLYNQFEIKPVQIFFLKKQAYSLSNFFSDNSSGLLFVYLFSETLEGSFKESQLVQSLHKLLRDDDTSPEVKYNSMGLLCRLLNSGNFILSCLWWKDGYLWRRQGFSVTKMSCLLCSSERVKDIRGALCIDHQKSWSSSLLLYQKLMKPSVE